MNVIHTHRRPARTALAGLALAGLIGLAGCSAAADAQESKADGSRTVTATATGSASGVPDKLTADVSIANDGTSAAAVLSENNAKTQALLDKLQNAGIDKKDIATTSVSLGSRYDNNGHISGYRAENSIRITLHDLKTAGARLDDVVQVGGDSARLQSISLGFNEDDVLLSTARVDAVKRAKVQAAEMARAAGARLGGVRTITDVMATTSIPLTDVAAAGAADASVPISAGSQELTVQVRVVYTLN